MKLVGTVTSAFVRKVRIVLAEKKIDYDFEIENPWPVESGIATLNPLLQVPVLVLDDGTRLIDSRMIVEFLDNVSPHARLIPTGNRERSDVRRWEALADGVLDAGILVRMERQRSGPERSASWVERQMAKVHAGLALMDADLGDGPWCTSSGYTLADIALGCCLAWLEFRFPEIGWRAGHANLERALTRLSERPSFADTVPRE